VTTIAGTAGRPVVDGEFIGRNSGTGPDFFSLSIRISRAFALGRNVRLDALVEAFNLTNRVNVVTVNSNFGLARIDESITTFGQILAVGDPRAFQLGARLRF
jgi:hypothetical protein